ncbi:hypothetical protein OG21DRAFT_1604384 [Imleria badia]|nr:hypothetical protein OG21DRAFT_1604384 [Imleria badia]
MNASHAKGANATSPQPLVLTGHTRMVYSIGFHPDGNQFVSGSMDGTIRTWNTHQAREVRPQIDCGGTIFAMAISTDGRWIATSGETWRVLFWDASTHAKVGESESDSAKGHAGPVECLAFSADATKLVSGAGDTTVVVWRVPTGEHIAGPFRGHVDAVTCAIFSPDGDRVASTDVIDIRIRACPSGTLVLPLIEMGGRAWSLAWAPAPNDHLIYASCDNRIRCIDASTGAVCLEWTAHPLPITCITLSRDGQLITSSSNYAKTVQLWDTATQQELVPALQHGIDEEASPSTSGIVAIDDDDNPESATTTLEEGPHPIPDKRFPNDLTNQVIRDGHDPVASGGFADIYRGMLQENGESVKVAIKSIKTYSSEDGDFAKKQKRLRREIKVWLNLRHVNVLPLLGTAMGFGRFPAMVCPWVENGPLTSYLEDRQDSLSVIEILGLLNNVASGLQYLHSRSVVHGDLSGSNVLIRENGRAYISDFGLSMLLTELGESTFATSFHARGTLRWTAPELLDLEVPEDDMEEESPRVAPTTQSDVYSFGCIMLQEHQLGQLETVDQQRELMRYMSGLNDWLARDVQDRQAESRAVAARVDQLREDLGRLGIGAGPGGPYGEYHPTGPRQYVHHNEEPDERVIPSTPSSGSRSPLPVPGHDTIVVPWSRDRDSGSSTPSQESYHPPHSPKAFPVPWSRDYDSRSSTPPQESYHPPHSPKAFPVPPGGVPNVIPVQLSLQGVPTGPIVVHPPMSTTTTLEQGPIPIPDERFPNDLTNQVIRDGHDPVASGGFADIYRGMLQENGESIKVAIKAIKTYSGEDGDFSKKQKRLRREIKVWLDLKHVNVLPLLGTTMGFGRFPAMVCPWVENGPLTSYLEDCHDRLSVVEILGLLNNVTSGLQYLHARSVVHGDLSGSNVLIRENGRAYISDFGLSMLLTELGGSTFATSFHARGTLRWTAPELLDLEVPEDDMEEESPRVAPTTQSDVYSFGCIMLQILSGRVPYHYYTREAQVVHAVSRGMTPRRPSSVLVTERRWTFILRCWSTVDVARSRPSSEEIVAFTEGELVGAGTSPTTESRCVIDAKEKRKTAHVLCGTATTTFGDESGLARRGGLSDGDGADDASHRNRSRVEERQTTRVDLRREEHVRVYVCAQARGGQCLHDDLYERSRVSSENARALEDAFECDAGVFFGGAGDGGERADVEVDDGADGVFGGEAGGDGVIVTCELESVVIAFRSGAVTPVIVSSSPSRSIRLLPAGLKHFKSKSSPFPRPSVTLQDQTKESIPHEVDDTFLQTMQHVRTRRPTLHMVILLSQRLKFITGTAQRGFPAQRSGHASTRDPAIQHVYILIYDPRNLGFCLHDSGTIGP